MKMKPVAVARSLESGAARSPLPIPLESLVWTDVIDSHSKEINTQGEG